MFEKLKELFTSKKFYYWILGLLISGATLIIAADSWIMPAYTNYNEGVTVPDLTQISLEEAEELLQDYGLRYEVNDRRSNTAFPANYIIDQTPSAAKIVKPNRKIYLTVNTESQPTVVVPDVQNLSLRNAEIQLQNYGLTVGTISYESSRFKNTVMRQSIEPGESVDKGSVINLTVSDGLGENMVEVPDIVGKRLSEAQQELSQAGLRVGEIRFQPTDEVPPNVVIDISPDRDELTEGEEVRLLLSERENLEEESESGAVSADSVYIDENPDTSNN